MIAVWRKPTSNTHSPQPLSISSAYTPGGPNTLYLGPASELDPALHQATTRLRQLTDTPLSSPAPIIDTIETITADTVVAVYR